MKGSIVADNKAARSQAELRADIQAARARLSANVENLVDQVHPANVKQRQIEGVKTFVSGEVENAKSQFKNSDGSLRTDRLALIGGSIAGVAVFAATIKAIRGKKK